MKDKSMRLLTDTVTLKKHLFVPIISVIIAGMILICSGSTVSAESKSQINVLPDTNTNIFDENMLILLSEITETAAESENVSVYYCDTKTGYYFYYNPGKIYKSASTIKAIYCQYIVQSGADLNRKVKLSSAVKSSSSGKLTQKAAGKSFTVDELIQYAIVYSDNMAYRLLYETFGFKGFNDYIKSLGLQYPQLDGTREYANVTAKAMGKCMLEIYRYSEDTGNTYIIDLLKKTAYNMQLSKGTIAVTAHKYGKQGGADGYHDVAVVYADEPYILSVFTNVDADAKDCNDVFIKLSELTEKLHSKIHSAKEETFSDEESLNKTEDSVPKKKIHYISYEEYMELLSEGITEIIDDCDTDCEYHVKGIGKVFD